ncbi:hypothetical protein MA16_Dca027927 [Dendrobium catenatum]|uniref:Uncharacterized protein n=1 Tax=Dendrobium catenatum TaxID=906689 RepID=A0A2I0XG06_9ASPA|nr:hypothetical protein MA16_Dca027927 [Dendrobium catenatum]
MSNQPLPGTFPRSIGFHFDGSVYLDGRKLESEKEEWADVNRVIGCGFAPRKKNVLFTVDSQVVHVLRLLIGGSTKNLTHPQFFFFFF